MHVRDEARSELSNAAPHASRDQDNQSVRRQRDLPLPQGREREMTRNSTTRLENRDERIFSSPVALAFVRIVVERRGLSEAQARKVYLDYIDRSKPADSPRESQGRVNDVK